MAKDNKFEEIRLEFGKDGSVMIDIFMIIWAASAEFDGVFQKSRGVPHDTLSLRVEFMSFYSYIADDFLELTIQTLEKKRLIKRDSKGFITIINFAKYQEPTSVERVKEFRERQERNSVITDIIHKFNKITGKNFSTKTEETRKHINARLAEGHTVEEVERVIAMKYNEWKNVPKMRQYITPQTIFRPSNFDRYVNSVPNGFSTDPRFDVEDAFGNKLSVTQEEFDKAEKDFLTKL